jgi:hypothetical protein
MIQVQYKYAYRTALGIGLLLLIAGCSKRQSDGAPLHDAISKTMGFTLPADATILAYHHQHDEKNASQCSQLWVVQAAAGLSGPDRRVSQSRAKSPFVSLRLLVEQMTDGKVVIEAADRAVCECIEWRHGETICRLRQVQARTGWVVALEAVSPE